MTRHSVMAIAALLAIGLAAPQGSIAQDQPRPGISCPVDHDQLVDIELVQEPR